MYCARGALRPGVWTGGRLLTRWRKSSVSRTQISRSRSTDRPPEIKRLARRAFRAVQAQPRGAMGSKTLLLDLVQQRKDGRITQEGMVRQLMECVTSALVK